LTFQDVNTILIKVIHSIHYFKITKRKAFE